MTKKYKQIVFDLDTKMLEKYYPRDNWRKAYDDIKEHMLLNGFEWQQGSVYVSRKKLSTYDITIILTYMVVRCPWLNKCMRDCRETDIGNSHDKSYIFNTDEDIPTREDMHRTQQEPEKKGTRVNIKTMIKKNKTLADEINGERDSFRRERGFGIGD